MSMYTDLAADVSATLAEFGAEVDVYPPGSAVAATPRPRALRVRTVRHVLGDSGVQVGDIEYLLDTTVEPEEGGRFSDGVNSYVIVFVEPVAATTEVMAWSVMVRHG